MCSTLLAFPRHRQLPLKRYRASAPLICLNSQCVHTSSRVAGHGLSPVRHSGRRYFAVRHCRVCRTSDCSRARGASIPSCLRRALPKQPGCNVNTVSGRATVGNSALHCGPPVGRWYTGTGAWARERESGRAGGPARDCRDGGPDAMHVNMH